MGLELMAKTKSAARPTAEQAASLAALMQVIGQYPTAICRAVIDEWDRRPVGEATFTPSAAELRNALEERGEAFIAAVNSLS